MEEKTLFDLSYDQVNQLLSILSRSGFSYKLAQITLNNHVIAKRMISSIQLPSERYERYSEGLRSMSQQVIELGRLNSELKPNLRIPSVWFNNICIDGDDNIQSVERLKAVFVIKDNPLDTLLYGMALIDAKVGLLHGNFNNPDSLKNKHFQNDSLFGVLEPGIYECYVNFVAGFDDASCSKPISRIRHDISAGKSRLAGAEILSVIASQKLYLLSQNIDISFGMPALSGYDKTMNDVNCDPHVFPVLFWGKGNNASGYYVDVRCSKNMGMALPLITDFHKVS
jgi:hypothetical protein